MSTYCKARTLLLAYLFLIIILTSTLPVLGQEENPSTSRLFGRLSIILSDNQKFESSTVYYLHTPSGKQIQIQPAKPLPFTFSGKLVNVEGFRSMDGKREIVKGASVTLADSESVSSTVSGTQKIAILLLKFFDSSEYTPNDPIYYSNIFNSETESVNAFYVEESYGLFGVQADIYGWYTLPNPRSYYLSENGNVYLSLLADDGILVADSNVFFPQYDAISFVLNDILYYSAWGGTWWINADGTSKNYGATWMPPWAQNIGTYSHEIGHSIGCPHTGWVYGTYDSIWDVESEGSWFNPRLRGSYYSLASRSTVSLYAYDPCHHISYHKIRLGWLDGSYHEITGDTTSLQLYRLAGSRIDYMAAKINIPGEDPSRRYFIVETRIKINYDQWLPNSGVLIHFVDEDRIIQNGEYIPSYPIDATPGTLTLNDAQWNVGTTYVNTTYGLTISVLAKVGDSYQISITHPNQYPTAYIDSISPSLAVHGQSISFSGHGTDPDGLIVAYNWRSNVDGQLSTSSSFTTSSLSIGGHTIYFKVQGDDGEWSTEVTEPLTIAPPPDEPTYPSDKWERLWYVHTGSMSDPWGEFLGSGPDETNPTFDNNYGRGTIAYGRSDYIGFISSRTVTLDAGTWTFTIGGDGAVRLFIDDELVMGDGWYSHSYLTYSYTTSYATTEDHQFRLEWTERTSGARVTFTSSFTSESPLD